MEQLHRLENSDNNDIDGVGLMEQGGHGPGDEKVSRTYRGGDFTMIEPTTTGISRGHYDDPPPCFGCGIGWLLFTLGFLFPPFWFYDAVLYLGNDYLKDPRERAGLAASAVAALICLVAVPISVLVLFCLPVTRGIEQS